MPKKTCIHEVATQKPTLDRLADDYAFALDQLRTFEQEQVEFLENYMNLQNKVQHFRIALESEAKDCAKVGLVDYDSDRLHIYVQRRQVRIVDPGILHRFTADRHPIGLMCSDMVKVNLGKLDEYVEKGVIPKHVYAEFVTAGEPELAFFLKEKSRQ